MGIISDLFKWKKQIEIKDSDNEVAATLWIRILGDWDLTEAYKASRVESAKMRKKIHDEESDEYIGEVSALESFSDDELRLLIRNTRASDYLTEALAVVNRGELPSIEEVATQPDGPSLEEQEKLDKATIDVEDKYQKDISAYIDSKTEELVSHLKTLKRDKLYERAKESIQTLIPSRVFSTELADQKAFRATYDDEECKKRSFASLQDFRNADTSVRNQIIVAYAALEISPEKLKN
jgi:hypothetical protein